MSKTYGIVGTIITLLVGVVVGFVRYELGWTQNVIDSILSSCVAVIPVFYAITGVLIACNVDL